MTTTTPNLVFIFPDQFRSQALGFMQQDPVITPNLDQFASESLVLTHAVSNYPVCSPYRAMLLSGKYPFSNGVIGNCYSETIKHGIELKASERCFSDVLHDVGYSQGYIGKLHLDLPKEEHIPYTEGRRVNESSPMNGTFWDSYTPPGARRHGFDFWHSYGCCDWHVNPHYWEGDAKIDERIDPQEWSVKHETDVAIDYLRNRDGQFRDPAKPFSLFVAHNPPHPPYQQVPPHYLEAYEGKTADELLNRPNVQDTPNGAAVKYVKNYFAAITGLDEQFGRIMQVLDEEGLAENTIVVFTADHGEMMGSHGLMQKNVWFDEALLVPFMIRWPGAIKPGQDDLLLSVPDIMPSLLNLMGVGSKTPNDVEGRDYSGVFLGQMVERPNSAFGLRIPPENPRSGWRAIRTHRHTLAVQRKDGQELLFLYDNERDPYQLESITDQHPALIQELRQELQQWLEKTHDVWLD